MGTMTAPKKKPVAPRPAVRPSSPDLFKEALAAVLVHEGGKSNHPKDPGRKTNKGITQAVYDAWRRKNRMASKDVYAIGDDEVALIYRNQYWNPIHGDDLPRGLGYVVFDGAVNSGVGQSVKWLQRALGVTADGVLGNVTLSAAQAVNDQDALIGNIIEHRGRFLRALKTFAKFGKGWIRRITEVEQIGQAWAVGSVGPDPTFAPDGNAKAQIEDAKKGPPKAPGDIVGTTGGAGVGLGGLLQRLQDQLTPLSSAGAWIEQLVVVLVIAGGILAVCGFAYRFYASWRKGKLADALNTGVPT